MVPIIIYLNVANMKEKYPTKRIKTIINKYIKNENIAINADIFQL